MDHDRTVFKYCCDACCCDLLLQFITLISTFNYVSQSSLAMIPGPFSAFVSLTVVELVPYLIHAETDYQIIFGGS